MQVYKCDVCGMIYDNYHKDQIGAVISLISAGAHKGIRKEICPKCRKWFENKLTETEFKNDKEGTKE